MQNNNTLVNWIFIFALILLAIALVTAGPMVPTFGAFVLWTAIAFFSAACVEGIIYGGILIRNKKLQGDTLHPVNEMGDFTAQIRGGRVITVDKPNQELRNPRITHYTDSRRIGGTQAPESVLDVPILSQVASLPTAPTWEQLRQEGFTPRLDKMLLGFNHNGPVYGDISALLSTAVAGRPGQGKSSLLRLVYTQLQLTGGLTVMLDPHGSISEDVPGDVVFSASTSTELDDAAYWLSKELDDRLTAYRGGKRQFKPLMALNDEFPVISLSSKQATTAIGRIVLEGRKVKMFSLISGQGLPASQFGGSLVRDALSSRYIFQTTVRQGQMAGLDKDAAKLLDMLDVGRCVLDGPCKPQIVAIPHVTTSDLRLMANSPATAPQEAASAPVQQKEKVVEANYRELPNVPPEIERAWKAYRAGANTVTKLQQVLKCRREKAVELMAHLRFRYKVP